MRSVIFQSPVAVSRLFTKPNFASSARRVRLAPKSTLHVTSLVVSFGPRPNTSYVHSVRLPVVSFGPRPNSSEPAALRTVLASPLPVAPPSLVAPAHHLLPCFIERDLSARRPRVVCCWPRSRRFRRTPPTSVCSPPSPRPRATTSPWGRSSMITCKSWRSRART